MMKVITTFLATMMTIAAMATFLRFYYTDITLSFFGDWSGLIRHIELDNCILEMDKSGQIALGVTLVLGVAGIVLAYCCCRKQSKCTKKIRKVTQKNEPIVACDSTIKHQNNDESTFLMNAHVTSFVEKAVQTQGPIESARGLRNLGNTCYFNSTMQPLIHTDFVFCEELQALHIKGECIQKCLEFHEAMQSQDSKCHSPTDLHNMFGKKTPKFADYRQHDSHECLRNFLDNIRKEERDNSGVADKRKVLTVVDKVFGGHFLTVYICKKCETPYHVFEALLDISLPIMIDDEDLGMNSLPASNRKKTRSVKVQTRSSQTNQTKHLELQTDSAEPKLAMSTASADEVEPKSSNTDSKDSNVDATTEKNRLTTDPDENDAPNPDENFIIDSDMLPKDGTCYNETENLLRKKQGESKHETDINISMDIGQLSETDATVSKHPIHQELIGHAGCLGNDTETDSPGFKEQKSENAILHKWLQDGSLNPDNKDHLLVDIEETKDDTCETIDMQDIHIRIEVPGDIEPEGRSAQQQQHRQQQEQQQYGQHFQHTELDEKLEDMQEQQVEQVPQITELDILLLQEQQQYGQHFQHTELDEKLDDTQEQQVEQVPQITELDKEHHPKQKQQDGQPFKVLQQDEEHWETQKQQDGQHRLNIELQKRLRDTGEQRDEQYIRETELGEVREEKEHDKEDQGQEVGQAQQQQEVFNKEDDVDKGEDKMDVADDEQEQVQEQGNEQQEREIGEQAQEEKIEEDKQEKGNKKEVEEEKDRDREGKQEEKQQEKDDEGKCDVEENDEEVAYEEDEERNQEFEVEQHGLETSDPYRQAIDKSMTPLVSYLPSPTTYERAKKKHVTIDDCLRYLTRKEHIKDEYLCNDCYGKYMENGGTDILLTSATKQTLIYNPPAVLTLHLKRFELKPGGSVKRTDTITYGEYLDIAPYCSSKCLRNDPRSRNIWYSLYGVVVHHGSTLKSGHYVAFVKLREKDAGLRKFLQKKYFDRDLTKEQVIEMMKERQPEGTDVKSDGNWYCVNDEWSHEVLVGEVLNQEAYILFYERMG